MWSIACSAPWLITNSWFRAPAVAIERAPAIFASCSAKWPTPPEPLRTRSEAPADSPARAKACWAVSAAQGIAAGAVLLVLNGSGGVGHFALQLAKIAGARSIATAGARNQEFVMSQGAEAAIDTSCSDLAGAVAARFPGGVDVVLDAIGGAPLAAALAVVKPGGIIVSVVDTLDPEAVAARGVRFERVSSAPSGEQLAVFAAHAGRKTLRPHVQTIFPLAAAGRAQEESRGGHVRGKLVLAL